MPLAPSTRLGPYEIMAPLGAGGMGEVYRARDMRLGRDVALKILPADVADDPSRRQRFELEARAVAALNHPNIVALYDVGDNYIVTELVDGEPLRGAKLSLRKTLDIAVQIADGLAAAHKANITHRDLKPDNILLTREGRVKILDFGLAKVRQAHTAAANETVTVRTDPGVVMGTVGYMSPEQVRGLDVDYRSDIFSFGVILHELLGGQRTFHGETSVDTMQAILRQDAPELPDAVPAGVRQVVSHCLEKDPANRFQSARDLGFALSALSQTGAAPVIAPRARKPRWPAIALVSAVLGVLAGMFLLRPGPAPSWSGVMLGGPEMSSMPRPSPKADLIAFVANDAQDVMQVWLMKPASGNRVQLTHKRDLGYVSSISWSADGSRIYYDRYYDQPKGIFSIPLLGGEEQPVVEDAWRPEALPDGSLLLTKINPDHQYQLFRYWPDTGKLRSFPVLPPLLASYGVVPGGHYAVLAGRQMAPNLDAESRLLFLNLESGEIRVLSSVPASQLGFWYAAAVTRDGKSALFTMPAGDATSVAAIPLSGSGAPRLLFTVADTVRSLDTGPDGSVYLWLVGRPGDLVRFSPEGGHAEKLAASHDPDNYATVLPDGRAVWAERNGGRLRLTLVEPGKASTPLAATLEENTGPVTAAGKGEVAFLIGPPPSSTIAVSALANGRITHRIAFGKGPVDAMAASPDGKTLYCSSDGAIWEVSVAGGEPRKLGAGNFVTVDPSGESLIVEVQEPPTVRLVRIPLNGAPQQEIPLTGPFQLGYEIDPNAIRNGRLLAPLGANTWYWPPGIFDLATGKSTRIPLDYTGDFHRMAWTPDGKIIALAIRWRYATWKFTPEVR